MINILSWTYALEWYMAIFVIINRHQTNIHVSFTKTALHAQNLDTLLELNC